MESLIAGAKKKTSWSSSPGRKPSADAKGLAELETAFNKRYGLSMKIGFAAGPDMNARAAGIITENQIGTEGLVGYFPRIPSPIRRSFIGKRA